MQLLLTPDATAAAEALQARLIAELTAGKSVLWLLPGGSNIPVSVTIMHGIPAKLTARLTLALTDERYGPVGHKDSNWYQLDQFGFDSKQATQIPVLIGQNLTATVANYEKRLKKLLKNNEVIIGQYGMGPDGHIAGILPDSEAVAAPGLVAGYKTPTFTRITTTFAAIQQCTIGYLLAYGSPKLPALKNLLTTMSLGEQPAQILKLLPEAYVFNDQIGDSV